MAAIASKFTAVKYNFYSVGGSTSELDFGTDVNRIFFFFFKNPVSLSEHNWSGVFFFFYS